MLAYPYLNEYSWTKAREYEYIAFTGKDFAGNIVASNQSARDQQFEKMFRSVGQVIHLVQDLAQPSHTRNDAHISAGGIGDISYLEYWAEGNFGLVANFVSASAAPKAANSYDAYFDQLAGYSNTNFFSDDTIFKDYALPNESQTSFGVQTVAAEDGKMGKVVYLTKTTGENAGCKLAQAGYFFIELTALQILASPLKYHIGDEVAQENASFLIPKAVEYSAGILDYFFRGKIEVIQSAGSDPLQASIAVKNLSTENMNGVFSLYYDTPDGTRKPVAGASWTFALAPDEISAQQVFTEPTDINPKKKYALVFQGQLGSEFNAVAGTAWNKTEKELVFVSLSAPNNVSTWIVFDPEKNALAQITKPQTQGGGVMAFPATDAEMQWLLSATTSTRLPLYSLQPAGEDNLTLPSQLSANTGCGPLYNTRLADEYLYWPYDFPYEYRLDMELNFSASLRKVLNPRQNYIKNSGAAISDNLSILNSFGGTTCYRTTENYTEHLYYNATERWNFTGPLICTANYKIIWNIITPIGTFDPITVRLDADFSSGPMNPDTQDTEPGTCYQSEETLRYFWTPRTSGYTSRVMAQVYIFGVVMAAYEGGGAYTYDGMVRAGNFDLAQYIGVDNSMCLPQPRTDLGTTRIFQIKAACDLYEDAYIENPTSQLSNNAFETAIDELIKGFNSVNAIPGNTIIRSAILSLDIRK